MNQSLGGGGVGDFLSANTANGHSHSGISMYIYLHLVILV